MRGQGRAVSHRRKEILDDRRLEPAFGEIVPVGPRCFTRSS